MSFVGAEIIIDTPDYVVNRHICKDTEDFNTYITAAENGDIVIKEISSEHVNPYREEVYKMLKKEYLNAKGYYELIKSAENEINKKILDQNNFLESVESMEVFGHGRRHRIRNPKLIYTMSRKDIMRFKKLLTPIYEKVGLAGVEIEKQLEKAEYDLVEYGLSIIADDEVRNNLMWAFNHNKHRQKIIDIIMQLPC